MDLSNGTPVNDAFQTLKFQDKNNKVLHVTQVTKDCDAVLKIRGAKNSITIIPFHLDFVRAMVPEIKFPSSNQPSKMTRRFQNTPLFKTTLIDVDIQYVTDLDIFIYFKLLYSENQAIKKMPVESDKCIKCKICGSFHKSIESVKAFTEKLKINWLSFSLIAFYFNDQIMIDVSNLYVRAILCTNSPKFLSNDDINFEVLFAVISKSPDLIKLFKQKARLGQFCKISASLQMMSSKSVDEFSNFFKNYVSVLQFSDLRNMTSEWVNKKQRSVAQVRKLLKNLEIDNETFSQITFDQRRSLLSCVQDKISPSEFGVLSSSWFKGENFEDSNDYNALVRVSKRIKIDDTTPKDRKLDSKFTVDYLKDLCYQTVVDDDISAFREILFGSSRIRSHLSSYRSESHGSWTDNCCAEMWDSTLTTAMSKDILYTIITEGKTDFFRVFIAAIAKHNSSSLSGFFRFNLFPEKIAHHKFHGYEPLYRNSVLNFEPASETKNFTS